MFVYSSKGATIEVVFRHPHFTAYEAASVVDGIDSLISKLFICIASNIQYFSLKFSDLLATSKYYTYL